MLYYSYPFSYYDRNVHGMPAPAPIQPLPPVMPVQPQPIPPAVQPAPPMMPVCPYMSTPAIPGTPVIPIIGPTGNITQPMLEEGIADIYEEMEDEMDVGPATANAGDPPPVLSNNPATTSITLFKELTAYPNYGNPSGNADILYTGNRGTWTFNIPANIFAQSSGAQIVIRGVLDDHSRVPVSQYSARITINGAVVHNGPVPLAHGVPEGRKFTNWKELEFNIPDFRRNNQVVIVNTSTANSNDWIGLDWMELRLAQR